MRFACLGHDVSLTCAQDKTSSVLEIGRKFSGDDMQHMTSAAPVVGFVACAVLDFSNAQIALLDGLPDRLAGFARMLGGRNLVPIDSAERDTFNLHEPIVSLVSHT